jgi:Single-strand binding protein family
MSLRGIMIGAFGKAVDLRTSKNGKQFATFQIRENVNGATRWWQAIAFSENALEVLKEIPLGEPIAVAGEITAEIYAPAGSESRINWRITVDSILSARKVNREGAPRKPRAAKGRDRAEASWAAPAEDKPSRGNAPFNDSIPFMCEWR